MTNKILLEDATVEQLVNALKFPCQWETMIEFCQHKIKARASEAKILVYVVTKDDWSEFFKTQQEAIDWFNKDKQEFAECHFDQVRWPVTEYNEHFGEN